MLRFLRRRRMYTAWNAQQYSALFLAATTGASLQLYVRLMNTSLKMLAHSALTGAPPEVTILVHLVERDAHLAGVERTLLVIGGDGEHLKKRLYHLRV